MTEKRKITEAIEDFEYYNNGFNHLCSAWANAVNVRLVRRDNKIYADIVLRWAEEGKQERYDNCEYALNEILERVKKLETIGYFSALDKDK